MHVPDGFLDAPDLGRDRRRRRRSASALALRGARRELDDRTAPMAGLVAAFVFAAQMLNFPVAAGTSGHLLGGALAAVLVGPWTAVLCMSDVLLVQGLLFADGGITALGTNITLMGLVTVGVGWLVFVARCARCCPSGWRSVAAGRGDRRAGLRARSRRWRFVAALRDRRHRPGLASSNVATAMVGVHVLIGIGEARHHRPRGRQRSSPYGPTSCTAPARCSTARDARGPEPRHEQRPAGKRHEHAAGFVAGVLLVALLLAGRRQLLRERRTRTGSTVVAEKTGFVDKEKQSPTADSPFAGYATKGVDNDRLSGGVAGVVGVPAGAGPRRRAVLGAARRRRRTDADEVPSTPTRRPDAWAPGTATGCTSTGTRRAPGAGAPEDRWRCSASCSSWWRPRGTGTPPSPVYLLRSLLVVIAICAGAADLPRSSGWSSRSRSCSSRCCCRSSPTARSTEVLGLSVSASPACVAAWRAAGQGHASACSPASPWRRPPSRRTCWSACERLRLPDLLVQIMGVHGPLPRRGHRRDAAG